MNKEKIILNKIIAECNTHAEMLNYAYGQMEPLFPFTGENVRTLEKEDIARLDQYIFRFSKLQDAIGQKLFKKVLQFLGEEIHHKSFIDIFNRLEQLGVTDDYEQWSELRTIRNEISHEYDENKDELAEKLNKITGSKNILEQYLNDVLSYLKARGWDDN